jgi:hypothetical protein
VLPFDSGLEESFWGGVIAGDAAWYRSPQLLGGVALALSIALYIPAVVIGVDR